MKCKMVIKFPSDWEKTPGEKFEYRKKVGLFEIIATEQEGVCEKCAKSVLGYLYKTIEINTGKDVENSEVYWCPDCGGISPEDYEKFVRTELLFQEGI